MDELTKEMKEMVEKDCKEIKNLSELLDVGELNHITEREHKMIHNAKPYIDEMRRIANGVSRDIYGSLQSGAYKWANRILFNLMSTTARVMMLTDELIKEDRRAKGMADIEEMPWEKEKNPINL